MDPDIAAVILRLRNDPARLLKRSTFGNGANDNARALPFNNADLGANRRGHEVCTCASQGIRHGNSIKAWYRNEPVVFIQPQDDDSTGPVSKGRDRANELLGKTSRSCLDLDGARIGVLSSQASNDLGDLRLVIVPDHNHLPPISAQRS